MKTKVLKGKPVVEKLKEELKAKIESSSTDYKLAIFRVGDEPGAVSYEKGIKKTAESLGVELKLYTFEEGTSEDKYIKYLEEANKDDSIHGILLLKPLPKEYNESKIVRILDPNKDVDCVHPSNLSRIFLKIAKIYPCTPDAVVELLQFYEYELEGSEATIINRSFTLGRPLAMLLLDTNATISVCHSRTDSDDLKKLLQFSDIVVTGVGKAKAFNSKNFNKNTTIVDVGISNDENGKISGDVDFDEVQGKVKAITPVIGGVGSITNTILFKNMLILNGEE